MLEKNLSNDNSLEVYVVVSQKNLSCTRKLTENRMNENPENWQCAVDKLEKETTYGLA